MHRHNSLLIVVSFLACLVISISASAQEVEKITEGPTKTKGPTKAEWVAAGLDPAEYNTALEYEVGIEEWKELERSRRNHITAGWSCVGVSVLGAGIVATIWLAQGWNVSDHPQMEAFAMSMVAIGATLITGIIVATTSPGPEDFVKKWRMERGLSFNIGSTTLTPGANGFTLTF